MNILKAIDDPKVFAPFFKSKTWDAWRVFFAALFALPMTDEQKTIYTKYTGRSATPTSPFHEAWLVIGRRGGKSFILAVTAVFLAAFKDWRPFLGPGEVATIMIIARDRRQARVIKRFITGLLHEVPMLRQIVENETQEIIQLRNNVSIEIHTASFRSTRGYTIVAALLDEIAFWEVDETSAEPDIEVINAIKPGMATIPGAMLLCASSPHARKGALWEAYRKHHGQDGDPVLVWQAATRDMNSSVPQSFIDTHMQEDPSRASAEYGAIFRNDLEAFVQREALQACVSTNTFERAPERKHSYVAFIDPSGGAADSMTLAIGHFETARQTVVVDAIREVRPVPTFSPEEVAQDFSKLIKSYNISRATADRWGSTWVVEQFGRFNITVVQAAKPRSDLYEDTLALINSKRIDLLDNPRCFTQLLGLERRVARGGKSSIDHAPGGHDDVANAVAGVASLLLGASSYNLAALAGTTPADDEISSEEYRRRRAAADYRADLLRTVGAPVGLKKKDAA